MALIDIINKQRKQRVGPAASAGDIANRQATANTGKQLTPSTGPAIDNTAAQLASQSAQATQSAQDVQAGIGLQQFATAEEQQNKQIADQEDAIVRKEDMATKELLTRQTMADKQLVATEQDAKKKRDSRESLNDKQMSSRYADALADLAGQYKTTSNDIYQSARNERSSRSLEEHQSFLDQVTHTAAMSDQKYVDTIRTIGTKRRLFDKIEFRKEATIAAFGNDLEVLSEYLDMSSAINADKRTFEEQLKHIDINAALELANIAAKEANYKQMLEGATDMTAEISKTGWLDDDEV